jgi:hypothetical protein
MGRVETAPLRIPIKLSICELDNHLQVVLETSDLGYYQSALHAVILMLIPSAIKTSTV